MSPWSCTECGARYTEDRDDCVSRFNTLLALDHSREEPWGSRHGQAFAAFALQHPARYAPSVAIVHLADFAAETYPALLDDWCRASLGAGGSPSTRQFRDPPLRFAQGDEQSF